MQDSALRFERIVERARATNPFYAEWLRDPEVIPVLDRATFLENNDRILNGHPVRCTTSGSTGIPVKIAKSPAREKIDRADDAMFLRWLGGPLVRSQIIYAGHRPPKPDLLDVSSPIDEQLAFIRGRYAEDWSTSLITYPTNALMLAQHALENAIDLGFIRRLGLISEAFDRSQKAMIQRAFPNAHIWSTYSSLEFGTIAAQCPHEPDFQHIMAHKLRVEVLDEHGCECADGETGRVVITDYFNDWSPFIRYEIGDLAVRARCPCGQIDLPAFGEIHGKVRGALLHRSGRRVLFADLSVALRDLPGMKQYQVIQDSIENFTVKVVATHCASDLGAGIATAFRQHFGYHPEIRIERMEQIPRDPNGKFYASICKVQP